LKDGCTSIMRRTSGMPGGTGRARLPEEVGGAGGAGNCSDY